MKGGKGDVSDEKRGGLIRMAKTSSQKIKSPSRFFPKFFINFPQTLLQILKIFLQLLARETISLSKDLCVLLHFTVM
jgi:hypothetical protein